MHREEFTTCSRTFSHCALISGLMDLPTALRLWVVFSVMSLQVHLVRVSEEMGLVESRLQGEDKDSQL